VAAGKTGCLGERRGSGGSCFCNSEVVFSVNTGVANARHYQSSSSPNRIYRNMVKRVLDFAIASVLLILLFPLLTVVAILIKLDSQGPVLFTQERLGQRMRVFRIYKFRTMVVGAVLAQKLGVEVKADDPRITSVGRFLRRFKVDELAQLVNVIKGDMSIVGPRPTVPDYIGHFEDWELEKFEVKPGLTGLAQVNGNICLEREQKSAYDVKYVREMSFLTDLKIILKTIAVVVFGEERFVSVSNGIAGGEHLNQ